ncbi:TlpA family protein disulfide reductase [Tautonia plasticadhaerens]|uniref:Thiol-disulfide oxidoreductase ResA n=1 Tax=Tautonia plasticadhaerens TaxID=2527974 RepID=A0A518GZ56_9BACT|nr:TlpA disulfide reductase family protein [Tautonia plasticadhaerens]QDV33884.1 Thiol-disulfide oxidoreductase ResA [Tautonia plasticadhaerens]
MKRSLFAIALLPILSAAAIAQEPAEADALRQAVKADPNSIEAINAYMGAAIGEVLSSIETDPDAAEKALGEMGAFLKTLTPTSPEAQQLMARANGVVPVLQQRITLGRKTLDELQEAVRQAPGDAQALSDYREKLTMQLSEQAYSAPTEASKVLAGARDFLAEMKAKAGAPAEEAYAQAGQVLDQLSTAIESNLARDALVGKPAAPLAVEAWVNGSPLTEADLKGKVVLLDFWAVWCGPCIATFPHLIEWDEQYGDKGLVILGLTNYYQFDWDEDAQRAAPTPDTTPEQERAMLEKFAAHHGLTHRFAIQDGDSMSEYYQVSGIPQAVVIDQEGKVRMVRVGSGEANAKAIGDLLAELLGPAEKAAE